MSTTRPDFVCIGPKRSATTWLADQLKLHRDIWLTPIQELNYLDGNFAGHAGKPYMQMRWAPWEVTKRLIRNKGLGIGADAAFLKTARRLVAEPCLDLEGYRELFAPAGHRLSGDISPMYASMTAAQITRALPVLANSRVLLLARDPVQRFWSELSMHARKRTFGDVDYGSPEIVRMFFDDPERQRQHFLSGIVERWREGIGADALRVFFFDDIVTDPEGSLRRIVATIGGKWGRRLPGIAPSRNRKQGRVALAPPPEVRAMVDRWFGDELARCQALFGHHGATWRARHTP